VRLQIFEKKTNYFYGCQKSKKNAAPERGSGAANFLRSVENKYKAANQTQETVGRLVGQRHI